MAYMYSIIDYSAMVADRIRTDAYCEALRHAVKPGAVVLDIGTGAGIFALLACRFGARKVYAIESSDVIQVAREVAAANGYWERIEFIQRLSTKAKLQEQADVIVSDIRGVLPLFDHHLPSIIDARERMLAPSGALIPKCDTLWAAVAEAPELYKRYTGPWEANVYGIDMAPARPIVTNTWTRGQVMPEQLLVEPQCWATLDYAIVESPDVSGEVTWTVARTGTAHGLNIWFDAILAEGVGFSNAPGSPKLIYGSAFFPWSTPVSVADGDTISVMLQANLVGEDYVWRWNTSVLDQGHPGQVKANFKQSTLFGALLSQARLRKRAASYVPATNEDGQIDQCILAMMDGELSLDDIAHRVLDRFPMRFPKWQDALTRVGELSEKYSR
jgi:protein arginine N-methyltransferase 1